MISVRVKKGFALNMSGRPSREVETLEKPDTVALLPEKIPFVKPRLKIELGEKVKIGTAVFEDKRNPEIKFVSPGGGEITDINFGPRRVIKKIVVALYHDEVYENFPACDETQIEHMEKPALIKTIMSAGLWPLIRQLPFRDIANSNFAPPSIIVSLNSNEPFHPLPDVYLKDQWDLFELGLKVLRRLCDTVIVSTSYENSSDLQELNSELTHVCEGAYPADDPGVLVYHIKTDPAQNKSWNISGQDVLLLARLVKTGKYPIERTLALGGILVPERKHVLTRSGGVEKSHKTGD